MEVKLSEEFISDLSGLSLGLRQKCWSILSTIRKEDAKSIRAKTAPGWRIHQLKSSPFTSISVDMNFRMLCTIDRQSFRVCRVVRHDLADAAYINRNDAVDTPYVLDNTRIEAKDVYDSLVAIGLPADRVKPFRGVEDEDGFVKALGQVDEYLQTYAVGLYETTGLIIPKTRYTLIDPAKDFETALRGSMQQWELYLHPSQRYIVELPVRYRLSVGGPAGTGKTVCAWYRIQHLVRQGYNVGFVCPNRKVFEVSKNMIESLLQYVGKDCCFLVPNSSDDVIQLTEAVDHVVVDEGQEFATSWFSSLGKMLTDSDTGLTLFYDLNQLGGNFQAGDTRRIKHRLDTWHSSLYSIPQLGDMGLSINYRNSREIAEYCQEVLDGVLPDNTRASLPLFGAGEVVVEAVNDRQELGLQIARIVRAFQNDYDDSEIGLMFYSYLREDMPSVLREINAFGIKTSGDVRNREMI